MRSLIILGNGFSIDLLAKTDQLTRVPVNNLFALGDSLPWPGREPGAFLSFEHTPNLWILGVRASNEVDKNYRLLEDIITCANAYYTHGPTKRKFGHDDQRKIYINAYKELVMYLKFLFIKLNSIANIDTNINSWNWADYLKKLEADTSITEVNIVTFNYDLFLERTLAVLGIEFDISLIGKDTGKKFRIIKPHGSISFLHNAVMSFDAFEINYAKESLDGDVSDFKVEMTDLKVHTASVPLIPPAGESGRYKLSWAGKLRDEALTAAKAIGKNDSVVICGLSYWHVDRLEIDEILLSLSDATRVALINPKPSTTLDAVLSSIFRTYTHYQNIGNFLEANYG